MKMTCVEHGSVVEGSEAEVSCPVYEIHVQAKQGGGYRSSNKVYDEGGKKKPKDLGIHGIRRENYTVGTNKNDRPALHDL